MILIPDKNNNTIKITTIVKNTCIGPMFLIFKFLINSLKEVIDYYFTNIYTY